MVRRKVVLIAETVMDGVGKHVVDIIEHLNKEAFDLYVIHGVVRLDYRFDRAKKRHEGHDVIFYAIDDLKREIHFSSDSKALKAITEILKTIKPDVVHCHSSKAGVLGRLGAKRCGIKSVYYTPHAYAIQGQDHWSAKKLFYWGVEWALAHLATQLTLNVSEGERHFAIKMKFGGPNRFKVIYNGIERPHNSSVQTRETDDRQGLGIPKSAFIIGCVARLYFQKNPIEFLEIAKKLSDHSDAFYFVWVGSGEMMDEMKNLAFDMGISDRIHFAGHQEDVDRYLNCFDVFLSTARYEGLPYTLVEALRAGLPIVATDVIGNNEVVLDGETGYLYPLGDVDQAVDRIEKLHADDDLMKKQCQAAEKRFLDCFTVDKMIKMIEDVYAL